MAECSESSSAENRGVFRMRYPAEALRGYSLLRGSSFWGENPNAALYGVVVEIFCEYCLLWLSDFTNCKYNIIDLLSFIFLFYQSLS